MDFERIVAGYSDPTRRVFPIEADGKRYWVKRATKDFPNPVARLIGSLVRRKASAGIDHEIEGFAALRRRGFKTPDVIYRNADFLVLTDIGPTLEETMTLAPAAERKRIASDAAHTLRRLHDAGGWHGAARIYNLTQCGGDIGFIDLENTVGYWLPPGARRFWDLWQLGHSIALYDETGDLTAAALRAYGNSPTVRTLWTCALLLHPFYLLLRPFQRIAKREVRQMIVAMRGIFQAGRNPAPT